MGASPDLQKGPFLSLLGLGATIRHSHWQRIRLGGGEWVQGFMGQWGGGEEQSQDTVMGLSGSARSSGEGCCDTIVTPSCPFFPQSTQLRPRQVAAFLLEPRCAWRVGHVWPCQP